jgi:hypothetical protein
MKSFKNFVAEVAQPKPEEEKRFKDMHSYEVVPHPVAEPSQHTGDIQKPKAKRLADQEGDANYDKPLKDAEKRMVPESVEQIDEISKALAGRYIKKAQVSSADAGMDTASQDREQRQRGIKTFLKRRKGVDSAVKRLMKDEELSAKQKKIDHNKNGKIDGHDLAMLRAKKKNEEVELDEAVKLKRGPMRLKDGSQIMVSKEDADLLNRMFKDLSPNNQRQMEKVMMMDKAGFEEIRGFAREAL